MTRAPRSTSAPTAPPRSNLGSIGADEVLALEEAGRRLGMEKKTMRHAQREGLKTIQFGRRKYVLGADVLAFFHRLRSQTPPA